MPAKRMTDPWVKSGKACAIDGKRTNWTDTKTAGLVLRVSAPSRKFPDGTKTWALSYRRKSDGKKRFFTIGKFSEYGWTLAKARQKAGELMAAIDLGADPAGDEQARKESYTFEELALEWVEIYCKTNKDEWKEDLRYMKADAIPVFGGMKAHEIRTRDIARLHEKKASKTPPAANRLLSALHKLFAWAISTDRFQGVMVNPASGIQKVPEMPRSGYLKTDEQIKLYFETIEASNMASSTKDILKIALLTGQRSGEPRRVKKADIDLEEKTWIIRKEVGKKKKSDRTKKDRILPMTPEVLGIFKAAMERAGDSEYVFPSPVFNDRPLAKSTLSRAWNRAREGTGLEHVNVHDMRRTLRTGLGKMRKRLLKLGADADIPDRITGHKKNQSTGDRVYDNWSYLDEMRIALEAWEAHIMGIVEGREADKTNVVALRG